MASKQKTVFICNNCGYESAKWYGKCPSCNEWGTMNEEIVRTESKTAKSTTSVINKGLNVLKLDSIDSSTEFRFDTGISELNRVLGGGLVKGSLVLLSGDPGIGKSTLLLQICNYLSKDLTVLYVSGEESAYQLKMRAKRLGVKSDNLSVMCETDAEIVCEYIRTSKPNIVMVDSIQTMNIRDLSSSTGSITQVRECTNLFMQTSKNNDISTILVGHVNKDGAIAGPKVLEHMVDCVLYFEGDANSSYRLLRAAKNRLLIKKNTLF